MAELPHWQPIDGVPPPMPEGSGRGRVVVLVASERAVSEGWAADAALGLARTWAGEGHRLILVDGGLLVPSLHAAAGLPNREGLTDATLYGASVGRVSQQLDDGKLFLISAGTPVADPQSVVRSSRWHRLSDGMSEAGVTTMLYVRDGESGAAAFLGSASDIVVLGAEGDVPPSVVRDLEPLVRAVAGPAGGSAGGPAGDSAGGPAGDSAGGGAKDGGSKSAVAGVDEGTVRERVATSSEPSGGIGKMLLFLIVAVAVAAALGLVLAG